MATFRTKIASVHEAGTMTTIDGHAYRTTVCTGQRITVTLVFDGEERTVAVPPFLAKALTKAERTAFDSMSYSHRKEYVDWVIAAKKTRRRAIGALKRCARGSASAASV